MRGFSETGRGQPRSPVPVVADTTAGVSRATLFETLASQSTSALTGEREAVLQCAVGRVAMLKASGETLAVECGGSSESARIAVLVQIDGRGLLQQGERRVELEPGDLCLLRGGRALSLAVAGPYRLALVEVPEDEIVDRFPLWRAAMLTPIRGTSGAPAVFCDAVRSLHRWQDSLSGAEGDHLADVLVSLIGALVCFAVPVNQDCLQQSLVRKDRIKRVVLDKLRDPDLGVETIAAAVGLSPRQVHRAFADEGTSLMRWVWVQRLEQCHRELCQDDAARRSISDIAYTWGFNDQAHFSRAFRRHFGFSPRDARRRAMRCASDPVLTD